MSDRFSLIIPGAVAPRSFAVPLDDKAIPLDDETIPLDDITTRRFNKEAADQAASLPTNPYPR